MQSQAGNEVVLFICGWATVPCSSANYTAIGKNRYERVRVKSKKGILGVIAHTCKLRDSENGCFWVN
jgi:hypothetical protein